MKVAPISNDAFNIVIVGAWNPAIFSPEWSKQNLADKQEQDVLLAIPMHIVMGTPRLTVDNTNIYPSPQSLTLDCTQYNEEGIGGCVSKLKKIAELLPHTPVSAVGVNFRFIGVPAETDRIAELFSFSDAARIDAETYKLSATQIRRTYMLSTANYLNLSIDSIADQLRIEFNFHSDVRKLADVSEKTTLERVIGLKNQANDFLATVYELELEI